MPSRQTALQFAGGPGSPPVAAYSGKQSRIRSDRDSHSGLSADACNILFGCPKKQGCIAVLRAREHELYVSEVWTKAYRISTCRQPVFFAAETRMRPLFVDWSL